MLQWLIKQGRDELGQVLVVMDKWEAQNDCAEPIIGGVLAGLYGIHCAL